MGDAGVRAHILWNILTGHKGKLGIATKGKSKWRLPVWLVLDHLKATVSPWGAETISPLHKCLQQSKDHVERGTMLEIRAIRKKGNKKAHEKVIYSGEESTLRDNSINENRMEGVAGGTYVGQCNAILSIPRSVILMQKGAKRGEIMTQATCKNLTLWR